MNYISLPNERDIDEDEERDLVSDAQDVKLAGLLDREAPQPALRTPALSVELTATLTREEILEEHQMDEFSQSVLETHVAKKDAILHNGVLCRQHQREPGSIQFVLPRTFRHR